MPSRRGGTRGGAAAAISPLPDGRLETFSRTKLCKFDQAGRCKRGKDCNYAHSNTELKPLPDFYCTRLCKNYQKTGVCSLGDDCRFAHGERELRAENASEATAEEDSAPIQWPEVAPRNDMASMIEMAKQRERLLCSRLLRLQAAQQEQLQRLKCQEQMLPRSPQSPAATVPMLMTLGGIPPMPSALLVPTPAPVPAAVVEKQAAAVNLQSSEDEFPCAVALEKAALGQSFIRQRGIITQERTMDSFEAIDAGESRSIGRLEQLHDWVSNFGKEPESFSRQTTDIGFSRATTEQTDQLHSWMPDFSHMKEALEFADSPCASDYGGDAVHAFCSPRLSDCGGDDVDASEMKDLKQARSEDAQKHQVAPGGCDEPQADTLKSLGELSEDEEFDSFLEVPAWQRVRTEEAPQSTDRMTHRSTGLKLAVHRTFLHFGSSCIVRRVRSADGRMQRTAEQSSKED